MDEQLGKARLDLTVDLESFRKNVHEGESDAESLKRSLEALAAMGEVAERQLNQIKMGSGQAAESRGSAEAIISGVRGISEESALAAEELDRVRITERQAAESDAAGEVIKRNVDDIGDTADRTKRKLAEVGLANKMIGGTSVGLLGAGIGAGALLAPVAGPGMLGLLAAIPALATTGAGALGTLLLAFRGVGKAIGGNEKAFKELQPAQQQFVLDIRSLSGYLGHLKEIAAQNLFPGLDRALHETLTPGTMRLISQAVAEFGRAIGQAGEMWGRYFGSPQFQETMGPLLREGAQGLTVFSHVALSLFDAMLKLGQAAIPFMNWLGQVTQKGASWVDSLIRQRDATGQLGTAMHEAEVSLTLLGRLVESLARVVGSLASALYPVSKVAVKDLTDGLNWLAGVISRNKAEIQAIVSGALAALRGALHVLIPILGQLVHMIVEVVDHMGGWKVAFAIIISGVLAKALAGVARQMLGVKGDAALAETEVSRLRWALLGLSGLVITISIILAFKEQIDGAVSGFLRGHGLGFMTGSQVKSWQDWQNTPEWAKSQLINKGVDPYKLPGAPKNPGNFTSGISSAVSQAFGAVGAALHGATSGPRGTYGGGYGGSGGAFGTQPPWTGGTGGGGGGGGAGRTLTGPALLGNALQNALQHAKDMAAQTQGSVAATWLHRELDDLHKAKKSLEHQLKGATGKQKTAIEAELRAIDGQITSVNVQITANLKAQAAAIKADYKSKLSTAKSAINSAMDQLKSALDSQFEAQTQAYIDTVLGTQFFQGVDPNTGAPRLTPLEQQLQAMQQEDQLKSLQDALGQAQTPEAQAAAQRALDEYNLQIAATKERQQADADYAKAVKEYQDERTAAEKQMNADLDALSTAIQDGTGNLGQLNAIAAQFGVTLTDQTTGAADSMGLLQTSTQTLAKVMLKEALALAVAGDTGDAKAIKQLLANLNSFGSSSTSTSPGVSVPFVPMAAGGIGRVNLPTLFYSQGNEDFAFSGEGSSFSRLSSLDTATGRGDIILIADSRELARASAEGLRGDRQAIHITAAAIKPALDRVVAVT